MSQRCEICKWWDKKNAIPHNDSGLIKLAANCLVPIPDSVLWEIKSIMTFDEGKNCKAYQKINEEKQYACKYCGCTHSFNEWHNFKPRWVCPSCQCSNIEEVKIGS